MKYIINLLKYYLIGISTVQNKEPNLSKWDILRRYSFFVPLEKKSETEDYVRQIGKSFRKEKINFSSYYIYPYDPQSFRLLRLRTEPIVSVTVDYAKILNSSLTDIEEDLLRIDNCEFKRNEISLIHHIRKLSGKIVRKLHIDKSGRSQELITFFPKLLDRKPTSFDEAIQKLLFYNALFWQAGHKHNGLGRLDLVLYDYYKNDLASGRITRNDAKCKLEWMCKILNRDMDSKSVVLRGDTGQYILLGGVDNEGKTINNELTELFLEVIKENHLPDPKIILRVNSNTSYTIWDKAIQCLLTGNGSPLLLNERVIMKSMVDFGYSPADVWNLGTSACWEPLIIGKSFDQNNPLPSIPVLESMNELLQEDSFGRSFEDFLCELISRINRQITSVVHDIKFDVSPLYSLFFDDCVERHEDFAQGGAKYSYHGIQILSFPNLINALLNLERFVYEEHIYSLEECASALKNDYKGYEEMQKVFLNNPLRFGNNDKKVVELTNMLMHKISTITTRLTINGNKVKVGFSSAAYIQQCSKVGASLDGRKAGEPFAVHISPVSHAIDIQEVIDFAGKLNYGGNRLNGNVVDFILPLSYTKKPEKLVTILKSAIDKGVFELQLNVLNAEILKDAQAHPEKYPELIVRVWGFSAYFKDLPVSYQDNLIKRASLYAAS